MLAIPQASIMKILNYTRIGNIIPKHSLTLVFDKILSTGRTLDKPLYRFSINKGRGIGGTHIIDNWMRP